MRVLLTNNTLNERAGSELYLLDVALELLRRGHQPVAYSRLLGPVARELNAATIPVIQSLDSLGEPPDIIHGQHHYETLAAALRFPQTPVISYCHGWIPWEEAPLLFPSILHYVAVDELCKERLIAEGGIPASQIEVIYNFFDARRFPTREPLPPKPLLALAFSNTFGENSDLPILQGACRRSGIELHATGLETGRSEAEPGQLLQRYDVVFAKARAAIEAMAVGCAVVLCNPGKLGPMVTSENFARLRPLNFGVRVLDRPLTVELLEQQLSQYDASDAQHVSTTVRSQCELQGAVDTLIALYERVIQQGRIRLDAVSVEGYRAVSSYLEQHATHHKELAFDRDRWYKRALAGEADRDRWMARCLSAEQERDRWVERCLASEANLARTAERLLVAEAQARRDAEQCQALEADRAIWAERCLASEANLARHAERLLVVEAEARRDAEQCQALEADRAIWAERCLASEASLACSAERLLVVEVEAKRDAEQCLALEADRTLWAVRCQVAEENGHRFQERYTLSDHAREAWMKRCMRSEAERGRWMHRATRSEADCDLLMTRCKEAETEAGHTLANCIASESRVVDLQTKLSAVEQNFEVAVLDAETLRAAIEEREEKMQAMEDSWQARYAAVILHGTEMNDSLQRDHALQYRQSEAKLRALEQQLAEMRSWPAWCMTCKVLESYPLRQVIRPAARMLRQSWKSVFSEHAIR